LIIAIGTLVVIFVALYLLISRTLRPISGLQQSMTAVAEGDLTVQADVKTDDEIGELSNHFNEMIRNTNEIIALVNESAVNVRTNSESLSAVSEETNASSAEVAHAINEIAQGASKSAEDAENATEHAQRLGEEINLITTQAGEMANIATRTNEMNVHSKQKMQQLKGSFHNWEENLLAMSSVIGALEVRLKQLVVSWRPLQKFHHKQIYSHLTLVLRLQGLANMEKVSRSLRKKYVNLLSNRHVQPKK